MVKVIIVADDPDRTAAAYEKLPESTRTVRESYVLYKGRPVTGMPMKVKGVLSENY